MFKKRIDLSFLELSLLLGSAVLLVDTTMWLVEIGSYKYQKRKDRKKLAKMEEDFRRVGLPV